MFQAVAPELVEKVYRWLCERGLVDAYTAQCCGHILKFAAPGDKEAQQSFAQGRLTELHEQGVRRIITSCPNCYYTYRVLLEDGSALLEDISTVFEDGSALIEAGNTPLEGKITRDTWSIEVLSLSEVLLEQGIGVGQSDPLCPTPPLTYCIHDSCPDRDDGVFAKSVRGLLENQKISEMEHSGPHSQCCGFGRLLGVCNPSASEKINTRRISEFEATGADLLVTYCFTCASAFSHLAPRKGQKRSAHYLELLFGYEIDWGQVNTRMAEAFSALENALAAAADAAISSERTLPAGKKDTQA